MAGIFIEPRLVPVTFPRMWRGVWRGCSKSSTFGTSSPGYAFGGGSGLVVKLSKTVNLDAGAALVSQKFGDFSFSDGSGDGTFRMFTTYAAKIGLNVGFPR